MDQKACEADVLNMFECIFFVCHSIHGSEFSRRKIHVATTTVTRSRCSSRSINNGSNRRNCLGPYHGRCFNSRTILVKHCMSVNFMKKCFLQKETLKSNLDSHNCYKWLGRVHNGMSRALRDENRHINCFMLYLFIGKCKQLNTVSTFLRNYVESNQICKNIFCFR